MQRLGQWPRDPSTRGHLKRGTQEWETWVLSSLSTRSVGRRDSQGSAGSRAKASSNSKPGVLYSSDAKACLGAFPACCYHPPANLTPSSTQPQGWTQPLLMDCPSPSSAGQSLIKQAWKREATAKGSRRESAQQPWDPAPGSFDCFLSCPGSFPEDWVL